jgi:hypothetical protein
MEAGSGNATAPRETDVRGAGGTIGSISISFGSVNIRIPPSGDGKTGALSGSWKKSGMGRTKTPGSKCLRG